MDKHYHDKAVVSMKAEDLHEHREDRIREDELRNHHMRDMFNAESSVHESNSLNKGK